jgi:small subunit ribosomal protein S4
MARYIGPVCKLCRREGAKLYLKGERCFGEKCSITRRPYPPGQHGQGRFKMSEYGLRLREKQKTRRIYGLLEHQFRLYYTEASRLAGRTGEEMLGLLERRLDNAVHRAGLAVTRAQARQLVRHNHIQVNGHRVNIPSYRLSAGDKIEVREKSRKIAFVAGALAAAKGREQPSWLEVDRDNFAVTFKNPPPREELNEPSIREQYVVEYYSR